MQKMRLMKENVIKGGHQPRSYALKSHMGDRCEHLPFIKQYKTLRRICPVRKDKK